ncbi:MAG: peptidase U32 family protein [Gammaproteobacteria bacterium]|nr:MAG: peptidase U32 family protein [Gammaproteobacteria bacterium]
MELVCPAGNLPALKAAVDSGADAVYIGFRDDTNARHFAGLNFNHKRAHEGIEYAHRHGAKVFVAINTFAQPSGWQRWQDSVDLAAELGVDALILADIGVMDYASSRWPDVRLHLSVQGSATNPEAIGFYHKNFAVQRVVVPRVLSLQQVQQVAEQSPVPLEVFGFGSLCVMVEGRCLLSSYVTGQSPNSFGACSPASAVRWVDTPKGLESRLNDVLIDRYEACEPTAYPTLCKGRFEVNDHTYYAIEEPASLNTLALLPDLQAIGIAAIKIEGRQRSPAYVRQVTHVWRAAIDSCHNNPDNYQPQASWMAALQNVSEGAQTTLGAYHRPWQ